jgi:hypothetical protein
MKTVCAAGLIDPHAAVTVFEGAEVELHRTAKTFKSYVPAVGGSRYVEAVAFAPATKAGVHQAPGCPPIGVCRTCIAK